MLMIFILTFGASKAFVENFGNSKRIVEVLPKMLFSLGWTKVGIVTKNGRKYMEMIKGHYLTNVGFTFGIGKSLKDFDGNYRCYDGFYLEDGLTTNNINDISLIMRYSFVHK